MTLVNCLKVATDITESDNAELARRSALMQRSGMSENEAALAAARDMLDEIRGDQASTKMLVRQQHADLFPGKQEKARSQFFTNPDEYGKAEPTYASRPVLNGDELAAWAKEQGIPNALAPKDMHVTVAYSSTPILAHKVDTGPARMTAEGGHIEKFGNSIVLELDSAPGMQERHQAYRDVGASWDHGDFRPHVTLSYDGEGYVPTGAHYEGKVQLGKETTEPLDTRSGDEIYAERNGEAPPEGPQLARAPQGQPGKFKLAPFGLTGRVIEALQDRYNRWKQTVETVKKQGGVVTEANDFYTAEERYWGKTATRIEDFEHELDHFLDAIAKDKLTLKDVQTWAYAKHAFERNAALQGQRAPGQSGFDSWSGMSNADAQSYIDDATNAGLDTALEKHRQTLMGWVQGTRDIMLAEGLITDDEYLRLSSMFDNYVPLRGLKDADGNDVKPPVRGTGSGFDIRGKETKKARGRYSEADNIIENIIADRVRTLIRAGKNEVLRSFLQFVVDNPSENLWSINAVEHKPMVTVDANGNQVIEEEPSIIKDARTVSIKDGGREVYVQVKDPTLLEQLKNLNAQGLAKWLGLAHIASRMLKRLYTSLSPTFTVLNGLRDAQEAAIGMIQSTGFRGSAKAMAGIPKALYEGMSAEFGAPSADYQLYRASGGKTGFFDMKSIDDLAEDLTKRLAQAERAPWDPRTVGSRALELIEKINGGIENATRLSVFKAARSEGKSLAEAASISKNITVNFNRKGTWAEPLGVLWLFYNPAVQGTARVLQTLRSPKALATIGAAMGGVAMLALRNASMGDDDDGVAWWDKVPGSVKDRNIVIMLPPGSKAGEAVPGSRIGRYLKIPMPYGYSFFASVANNAVDMWRYSQDHARGASLGTAMMRNLSAFLQAYVPSKELGNVTDNPKSLVMAMVPDVLNPVGQSMLNINSFGSQMYPEDRYNENLPDASKYFVNQAGTIYQRAAQKLNEWSGGSKFSSGLIDVTPATVENVVRTYGGGPASFVLDLMNGWYARQSIARPDLDTRRLPFVKQLYGQIDAETDRMAAFDHMKAIAQAVDPIQAAKREGNMAEVKKLTEDAGPIAQLGGALQQTRKVLSGLRKEEMAVINSNAPDDVKYVRLQSIALRKRQVDQNLNRAWVAAMRAPTKNAPVPALAED